MSHGVRVVCTPGVAPGFRLAGLRPVAAAPGADGRDRVEALRSEPGVGVLLVEQAIYEALPEETVRSLVRTPLPLVIPFPGPTWVAPPAAEEYVVELLRRAIGYRVRLR